MENGTDVKDVEVVADEKVESPEAPAPMPVVVGEVSIVIEPNGALRVSTPPNQIIALAIIEAGKAFITMQMQDQMRRSQVAQPPKIVRVGADALSKITRPS